LDSVFPSCFSNHFSSESLRILIPKLGLFAFKKPIKKGYPILSILLFNISRVSTGMLELVDLIDEKLLTGLGIGLRDSAGWCSCTTSSLAV
jgi:hypothetical protein